MGENDTWEYRLMQSKQHGFGIYEVYIMGQITQ